MNWIAAADILIAAFVIYQALVFIQGRRAMQIVTHLCHGIVHRLLSMQFFARTPAVHQYDTGFELPNDAGHQRIETERADIVHYLSAGLQGLPGNLGTICVHRDRYFQLAAQAFDHRHQPP